MTQALREVAANVALTKVGVDLSPEFLRALLPRPREKLVTGGTQAGKSVEGAAEIWIDLPYVEPDRQYLYWVIVPTYKAPHKEMDYLLQWAQKAGVVSWSNYKSGEPANNESCRLELFKGRVVIETKTSLDPEGIAGEPCDGVLVVEAGQMPHIIRTQCLSRVMTKRGWITYTGTLEDDEAKPRWAWYGDYAQKWRDTPTEANAAFSLPSWANRTIFPGGRNDPEILHLAEQMDEHTFNRRIAGIPSGVQFPVYPLLGVGNWSFQVQRDTLWMPGRATGGHDYGMSYGHLSTLVVWTLTRSDIAVMREAWGAQTGNTKTIEDKRAALSQQYGISASNWGFDPMTKEAADLVGARAVRTGNGARLWRAGLSEARQKDHRMAFDFAGNGVRTAFDQLRRAHLIKRLVVGQGEVYDYDRTDDDYAAAGENGIEVMDTAPRVDVSAPTYHAMNYGLPRRAQPKSVGGGI